MSSAFWQFLKTAEAHVQLISVLIAMVAAIFSARAANAASRSVTAAKIGFKAPIFTRLWDEYAGERMFDHIYRLVHYNKQNAATPEEVGAARYVFNFFHRVYIYHKEQLLADDQLLDLAAGMGYNVALPIASDIMEDEYKKYKVLARRTNWYAGFDDWIKYLEDRRKEKEKIRLAEKQSTRRGMGTIPDE